jgi:hypothetical protein
MLSGFIGAALFSASPLQAALSKVKYEQVTLLNAQGNRIAVMGPLDNGQGTFFLFDENGGLQQQMGAYSRGAEKGQSLFGMHDRQNNLRLLMRMHGPNDSPTLIMKDSTGLDRIVIGLDAHTQEPYINITSNNGSAANIIEY